MAPCIVSDHAELCAILAALSLDRVGDTVWILLVGRRLDVQRTYSANCKDLVIPGFGQDAMSLDCDSALVRFRHFVRSQFGQRGRFCFVFHQVVREYGYKRVRATFGCDIAAEYTAHAATRGQHDLYIAINAGDMVDVLRTDGDWALVKTCGVPAIGWVPSAYIAVMVA